ncbi:hypothetical protein CRE_11442 [Caenorhabditis remanei]|uniref:G-protein coupled receptors family 1 profile domain-containing protein n=1 Tax=Caenorhabditis remanei TaxID=31234 RepID=E3NBH6_CAERE|nr:hypothetical protein CRE_11442 [Caenorhabditis remanei]
MYLNTTNPLYDAEYLIKYPNLMLSIFGVVTNIIHIYFLSQTVKKHPIFVCFVVIGIADFFQFFSIFVLETVVVINYIDNRNCIGYINLADLVFKLFTAFLFSCGNTTAGWMITIVAIIQGRDIKFQNYWTQKLAATVSKVTVVLCIALNVFGIFTPVLVFCQLEYVVCSEKNLMQIYVETHSNGVTKIFWLCQRLSNYIEVFNVIFTLISPFYLIKRGKTCVDEKKKKCSSLIIYLLFSFLISHFGSFLLNRILVVRSSNIWKGLPTQASLVLPLEIHRLCIMVGANIRPWVFFTVSTEYQESMKAFFDISGGTVAIVPKRSDLSRTQT